MRLRSAAVLAVAVLAAGAAVFAVLSAKPAGALPNYKSTCTSCHAAKAGGVTATPSTTTPAAGAQYTVTVTVNLGSGNTGYWIANSTAGGATGTSTGVFGGPGAQTTWTATMTAPTAGGTYYYKVFGAQGLPGGPGSSTSTYSITVAASPSPAPSPTPAPVSGAPHITRVTPKHAKAGATVVIRGSHFGSAGTVRFGSRKARIISWNATRIVCKVPRPTVRTPKITVTPAGAIASNRVSFRFVGRLLHRSGDESDGGD